MSPNGKIFISHASRDEPLVSLLKETLVLGGVPIERIFYSSSRSTGIRSGLNVQQQLKESLQGSSLVIEVITETFLRRPFCLIELGAAWAMEKPTIPIIVPPLTRGAAVREIGEIQLEVLGSDLEIDGLMHEIDDRIRTDCGVQMSAHDWGNALRSFKAGAPHVVEQLVDREPPVTETGTDAGIQPPVSPASSSTIRSSGLMAENFAIMQEQFNTEVHGNVSNESAGVKMATMKATFYAADGNIVGTANGIVNQLQAGERKSFTLSSIRPIADYAHFEVQFEAVF